LGAIGEEREGRRAGGPAKLRRGRGAGEEREGRRSSGPARGPEGRRDGWVGGWVGGRDKKEKRLTSRTYVVEVGTPSVPKRMSF
jgi:hypothetical protein